ncbi:uncharacterized protein [Acropora muricata]|uniref:uncharacterized protein n=1 Tax=Acropora muricata TaxID=159855 RepID=UPI0034E56691
MKEKSEWPKMELAETPKVMPEMKSTKKQQQESTPLVTVQENRAQRAKPTQGGSVLAWILNPKRIPSWCRLVNIYARVRRALNNMSKRGLRQTSKALLQCEIRETETEVVRLCQREAFPGEYKALVTGKPIPTKSPLMKLNPLLDEEGCIRSNGRLQFAEYLPYDVRFPMILPRGRCVTKLIVKHYHEQANHTAGTNFVLSQINEKYWFIAAQEEM